MNLVNYISLLLSIFKSKIKESILRYRVIFNNPTMQCHHSVLWNYGYKWLDSITIGRNVAVMANVEIIVLKHVRHSSKEGSLFLGNDTVITTGCNIRAAGGRIVLGDNSAIGEMSVLIAANHTIEKGMLTVNTPWNEERTDVIIGKNVWVGANCSLLPGTRIGDNSVIGAGSVVTKTVPANEIWGGVPAKKIRDI